MYVPLLRTEDDIANPMLSPPVTTLSNSSIRSLNTVTSSSRLDSKAEVRAYAGPMSPDKVFCGFFFVCVAQITLGSHRPCHNFEKEIEESAAGSDSLATIRNQGNPLLAARFHLAANLSYFQFICTFQESHNTCFEWQVLFSLVGKCILMHLIASI